MANNIILGTVQFGLNYGINNSAGKPNDAAIFEMLNYACEHGIKTLDTANAYGNAQKIIGKFLKSNPSLFSINTKFHLSHEKLSEQLEKSLNELSVEKIDTYFFHDYNDFIKSPEILAELNHLKKQNRIEKIGVSVYDNNQYQQAIEAEGIDVIQHPFNLLDNFSKRGALINTAKETGKEIQIRSVFLQGLFFKQATQLPEKLLPLKKHLERVQSLAKENKLSISDMALAYALTTNGIDNVIAGIDRLEQLKKNLDVDLSVLSNALRCEIDQINVEEEYLLYPYNW